MIAGYPGPVRHSPEYYALTMVDDWRAALANVMGLAGRMRRHGYRQHISLLVHCAGRGVHAKL